MSRGGNWNAQREPGEGVGRASWELSVKSEELNCELDTLRNVDLHSVYSTTDITGVMSSGMPEGAFHISNPSFVPQGYVDSHSTLPRVTWEAVTRVEGIPC
jgi:hypothetical protein